MSRCVRCVCERESSIEYDQVDRVSCMSEDAVAVYLQVIRIYNGSN